MNVSKCSSLVWNETVNHITSEYLIITWINAEFVVVVVAYHFVTLSYNIFFFKFASHCLISYAAFCTSDCFTNVSLLNISPQHFWIYHRQVGYRESLSQLESQNVLFVIDAINIQSRLEMSRRIAHNCSEKCSCFEH